MSTIRRCDVCGATAEAHLAVGWLEVEIILRRKVARCTHTELVDVCSDECLASGWLALGGKAIQHLLARPIEVGEW